MAPPVVCVLGPGARVLREDAPSARVAWWSFGKTVIAAAALKLVEGRKLDLDRPLPGRAFSLRAALGHRAGLPDYHAVDDYRRAVARRQPAWTEDEMLARAGVQGPQSGWHYSNIGYLFVRQAIEEVTGSNLEDALADLVTSPLGLPRARLARTPEDMAGITWGDGTYDPNWVYPGCLIGRPHEAAAILHAICTGELLSAASRSAMMSRYPLGGAIKGRPWTQTGYGLGVMTGRMVGVGRAEGHSAGGPFSCGAVYRFAELDPAVTVAAFAQGPDEGAAERAAVAATRAFRP